MSRGRALCSARYTVRAAVLASLAACVGSPEPDASLSAVEPASDRAGTVAPREQTAAAQPNTAAASSQRALASSAPAPPGAAAEVRPTWRMSVGEEVPDDGEQTWVFDPAEVHTYELWLDPAVWAELQRNARQEQYAPAELLAAGRVLERVGLRFKGSLGTLESCFADDGSLRCKKLSMKLEFDEFVPKQRFFGLRRLNFNSMLDDDTLMHERLAYRVYRELGLVASRSAHARLLINGEDWGVFSLVEEVDGRFTDRHFEAGDGNLYKEIWPGSSVNDTALREELLSEALKTNEETADHAGFLQFHGDLRTASLDELSLVVERYLDVEATLAYLAVDQALINWDGVTAFYCYDGSFCQNHNYYWYQDEQQQRFTLIPWDLDNTFQSTLLTGVPGPLEQPADCSLRYDATGRKLQAPGCDPLLRGLVSRRTERYAEQLDRLLAGPLAPGVMEGWIDELQAQLEPQVLTDTRGPEVSTFQQAVARLRANLPSLREGVRLQRAGLR